MSKTIWKLMLHLLLYTHVQSCSETNQVCCRLWLKNCCKSRDFFYLLQQNLYILYILRARRPRVPTPARPPTTVITLTGDIMLAVIKNLFLLQMTGDMMVVAYCLERAHVGLSGLCHYWCGWARWHKTCIQEAVYSTFTCWRLISPLWFLRNL